MKRLLLFGFSAILASAYAASPPTPEPANVPTPKFNPPDGKVLLIVGQDVNNITAYLNAFKTVPAGFAVYTSVADTEGLSEAADNGGGVQHAQKLVNDHPNTVLQMGLYMVDSLEKVYSGDLNAEIDRLGRWIKNTKRPVYLRIGYEFDFPDNHYDPDQYVKAFRFIVDRYRKNGVDNVSYVWHSYASTLSRPHMDWYPGNEYVDWFAISYFDQPRKQMDIVARLADQNKKPLMIAEAAPWKLRTNKSDAAWKKWFEPMLAFIVEKNVKALCYINCNWDAIPLFKEMRWGDTRIQSNDELSKKWKQATEAPMFVISSPELFSLLDYRSAER